VASPDRVVAIRAVEALRCGVPNGAAVSLLGCNQPEVHARFTDALSSAKSLRGKDKQAPGLVIQGGFGAGKSHTLRYLEKLALEQGFVCSKFSISKETPLYDPVKVCREALYTAILPDRRGAALQEVISKLDFRAQAFAEFARWTKTCACSHLVATLYLLQHARSDRELVERITRFWSGEAMGVQEIRHYLAAIPNAPGYSFPTTRARDLALEKLRFAAHLMPAAGYPGWVILFDEVELVGCYGLLQRAKSYAEIARFLGRLTPAMPGVLAVFAVTDDFASAVLYGKGDHKTISAMDRVGYRDGIAASDAVAGMEAIRRHAISLRQPTAAELKQTLERVRELYANAYDWQPPASEPEAALSSTRMRQHLKRWIYRWDLARLCQVSGAIDTADLATNYTETPPLEGTSTEDELMKDLVDILTSPRMTGPRES